MITVLLPTYNCGKYLDECITSILSQSFTDYEILILDDGSTDDTESVVGTYKDERIRYVKNPQNLGIVATLNSGLNMARGKYIARMDADDVMMGDRLQVQFDFLERNLEFGMVGSWYRVMDVNAKILFEMRNHTNPDFLKLGLVFTNHFAHPAIMMRADLAKRLRYDKNFKHCEDHELWTRFATISKVTNLPYFFLHVRYHAASTCSLNQKDLKMSVITLLSRELKKFHIRHSTHELMLHAAICFGQSKRLIQDEQKKVAVEKWLTKIFSSKLLQNTFSHSVLHEVKYYVSRNAGLEN